ncbi:hypothetical protein GGS26DRAFT_539604 [Hypomontagnella submonticulosa]|nr:hypothetical protein GGS26DRAFT_539604 [Hypomontagnella submonticulosa]
MYIPVRKWGTSLFLSLSLSVLRDPGDKGERDTHTGSKTRPMTQATFAFPAPRGDLARRRPKQAFSSLSQTKSPDAQTSACSCPRRLTRGDGGVYSGSHGIGG